MIRARPIEQLLIREMLRAFLRSKLEERRALRAAPRPRVVQLGSDERRIFVGSWKGRTYR